MEEAKKKNLYETIGKQVDDAYIKSLKETCINLDIIKKMAKDIKLVYTPLCGAGNKLVRRVLEEIGVENVFVVKEQEFSDGNFPTIGYPNPEDPKVFTLAIELAKEIDADVIVGTDPDADRLGVVVKNKDGEYVPFTGNMTGALLAEYILSQKKEKGTLATNSAIVKTIVTTQMIKPIAESYESEIFEVLTGFKYIGEKIKEFELSGSNTYVFGMEESYGCLAGTYARDKDAVAATMMIAEVAAFYKAKGRTLYDGLMEIYEKYGYYSEGVTSITLKGIEGTKKIQTIMNNFRKNPPDKIDGLNVLLEKDYTKKEFINTETKEVILNNLPSSNVLHYTLENDSWVCIRPSGTEPKIKVYYGVKGISIEDGETKKARIAKCLDELIDNM